MLVSIVNVADKELLAPVVDAVKSDLGMTDTQIGMVRSAVFLAALLGQFFWGPLSDRWVRKYIIVDWYADLELSHLDDSLCDQFSGACCWRGRR